VTEPAAQESAARWLAYVHPLWMALSITLAAVALRRGLALRRARRLGAPLGREALRGHLRAAKPAVALLAVGFTLGPLSMWGLRDREPFSTAHALFGSLAFGLFLATAWLGRRLERGHGRPLDAHAVAALAALLAAGLAAMTGWVLLP
jgi:hypothetical protein